MKWNALSMINENIGAHIADRHSEKTHTDSDTLRKLFKRVICYFSAYLSPNQSHTQIFIHSGKHNNPELCSVTMWKSDRRKTCRINKTLYMHKCSFEAKY